MGAAGAAPGPAGPTPVLTGARPGSVGAVPTSDARGAGTPRTRPCRGAHAPRRATPGGRSEDVELAAAAPRRGGCGGLESSACRYRHPGGPEGDNRGRLTGVVHHVLVGRCVSSYRRLGCRHRRSVVQCAIFEDSFLIRKDRQRAQVCPAIRRCHTNTRTNLCMRVNVPSCLTDFCVSVSDTQMCNRKRTCDM